MTTTTPSRPDPRVFWAVCALFAAILTLIGGLLATRTPATAGTHTLTGPAGFLQDDSGSGYALSPPPGQPVGDSTPLFAYPTRSAWRLDQNTAGGQCNNGKVSYGLIDCPWTGQAAYLDQAYDGKPIFEYALTADTGLCVARVISTAALHACSARPVQLWVAADITGGGYELSVAATQAAHARKVLCGNGTTAPASITSPGACGAGHRSWAFTQPVNR